MSFNVQTPEIVVYADTNGTHVHQVYSGLISLAKRGDIRLKFSRRVPPWLTKRNTRQLLACEVRGNGTTRFLLFDLNDSADIASLSALEVCDLYFKRSFSRKHLMEVRAGLREKVVPFGLNYQVMSREQPALLRRLTYEWLNHRFNPFSPAQRPHAVNLYHMIRDHYLRFRKQCQLLPAEYFEASPYSRVEDGIIFQCRLWDPVWFPESARPGIIHLNETRASLVRVLRTEFGDRFVGGLQPNPYALDNFPELVTSLPTHRLEYLRLLKSKLIAIGTAGISDSIGWKFGEYVASARCIVTEPLAYELPGDFSDGRNYCQFSSVEQCLENCDALLTNPKRALEMREQNYAYYHRFLRPDMLVGNCIASSIDKSIHPDQPGCESVTAGDVPMVSESIVP